MKYSRKLTPKEEIIDEIAVLLGDKGAFQIEQVRPPVGSSIESFKVTRYTYKYDGFCAVNKDRLWSLRDKIWRLKSQLQEVRP